MDLDFLRELCLSLPHSTESLQWGEELCFKVGGKLFAIVSLASVPQHLTLKCDPEKFAEMTEREGIVPAPYVGRYKWIMLENLDALPASELTGLIRESYAMVARKKKWPVSQSIRNRKGPSM